MPNDKLIEMINNNDELKEFSFTNNIKATYFITSEGQQISFGYDEYLGRLNDHRVIFGLIEGVKRNDFKTLINKTNLLVYMPECNNALFLSNSKLTKKQLEIINKYNIEVIYE